MATNSQLTALCAVSSFLWLSYNLEDHQIIEYPRLSSFLILSIGGTLSFVTSAFSLWLPGANGRFDDDSSPLKGSTSPTNLPKKPRRFFYPALVLCIVLRLELFYRLSSDLACSTPGIEAFLPLTLLCYELLPGRRARLRIEVSKDRDIFTESNFDVLKEWMNDSRGVLAGATLLFTFGAYLALSQTTASTFFCSSIDKPSQVIFNQWSGLLLDGIIIILLWRILSWARTTKGRLRTLGGILLASAVATALMFLALTLISYPPVLTGHHFGGLDPLYIFDMAADGLAFSAFFISASLLICEGTPLTLTGTITFVSGLLAATQRLWLVGTWENVILSQTWFSFAFLCFGFPVFVYANDLRSVIFIRRAFLTIFLAFVFVAAVIYIFWAGRPVFKNHPLEKLIYDTRIDADRWLLHASVSKSLKTAVSEYRERHHGRDPPLRFDIWYSFATQRNSPIIDHYAQIERDILPFWGISPDKIRQSIARIASEPDVAVVRIQEGAPSHNVPKDSPDWVVLDDLINLIRTFSGHLPDMELAINLNDRPRVLAPWDDIHRFIEAGKRNGLRKNLLSRGLGEFRKSEKPSDFNDESQKGDEGEKRDASAAMERSAIPTGSTALLEHANFTSVQAFREMTALTCPPGSPARSGVHWNMRDFCSGCARPQSQGQFLTHWDISQSLCHQPDLIRLHSFHMTPPQPRPVQELLPLFGRTKTDSYSDILIPLRRVNESRDGENGDFEMTYKKLLWRGNLENWHFTHDLFRGGHQERLMHLVNNASASDRATAVLATVDDKTKFAYENVATTELNAALSMDVGINDYGACEDEDAGATATSTSTSPGCLLALREFGQKPTVGQPLNSRYILLTDGDTGPPADVLRALRSASVPFVGTIFREWYTERLHPWLHFVPVDLRFHALHSTLAYFAGLSGVGVNSDGRVNGRDVKMGAHNNDAKWIAEQGRHWASRALRREDMEVYMFRLLLEWGRVVDDKRDEGGFVLVD